MKTKLKIVGISTIICIVVSSLYKILLDKMLNDDPIFFKVVKIVLVVLVAIVVALILYSLYLQKVFEQRYKTGVKIYMDKSYWREVTIIVFYSFVFLYYVGVFTQIWSFIFIPYISVLIFGFRSNQILVDYEEKLYFVTQDYVLNVVKEINYNKINNILILKIINSQNNIVNISLSEIKKKKVLEDLYILLDRYNICT